MSNQATLRPAPSMSEIKRLCSDLCASLKGSQRAGAELTTINTLSAALSQFPCGRPTTFALVILRQHLSKLYATDSSEVAFQIAACLLMEASRGIVACTDLVSLDASKERQNTEPDAVKAAKEWNACMRIILVGLHVRPAPLPAPVNGLTRVSFEGVRLGRHAQGLHQQERPVFAQLNPRLVTALTSAPQTARLCSSSSVKPCSTSSLPRTSSTWIAIDTSCARIAEEYDGLH